MLEHISTVLARYDALLESRQAVPTFALLKEHAQARIPLHYQTESHPFGHFYEDVRVEAMHCFDKNLKALHRQLMHYVRDAAERHQVDRAYVYHHQVVYNAFMKFCEENDINLRKTKTMALPDPQLLNQKRRTRGEAHKHEETVPEFKGFLLFICRSQKMTNKLENNRGFEEICHVPSEYRWRLSVLVARANTKSWREQ